MNRTLPVMLERSAERYGEETLVRCGEQQRSFVQMRDASAVMAGTLAAAGVEPGDRVAVMSDNRLEVLDLWLGCAWLGAVFVPVNTALRGGQLAHVLSDSGARLLAIEPQYLEHVDAPPSTWVIGESLPEPAEPLPPHPARPGDTAAILYTSGTTGPSKGVLCPHAQWYWWGVKTGGILGVREGDVLYTCLPLFHTNALNTFVQALLAGATYVPGPRFSASALWQRLAESGATVTYLLGAMVHILASRPPGEHDRAHSVRITLAPASSAQLHGVFRDRFGIRIVDGWGSTETNVVLATAAPAAPPGSMGSVIDGFDARVVDEDDEEVPAGTPGELVVRSDLPYAFATGYHGLPDKTVESWRNLWFHTGDRVVCDEDGWFWFVDRLKDSIRRRGENISSYEVEAVLTAHPEVAAAAVVPVPAEVGEDEVLACVVRTDGSALSAEELVAFCGPRLAYFAVPRYVDFVDELPLTANGKIEKFRLRERGVTATTWDAQRARVS